MVYRKEWIQQAILIGIAMDISECKIGCYLQAKKVPFGEVQEE